MDRRIKNLLQNYRWLGSSIINQYKFLIEHEFKSQEDYIAADKYLTTTVQRYELLKQIMIER